MSVRNEVARLLRSVAELEGVVHAETRGRTSLTEADRRYARNEIEAVIQRLSELRERLG